MKPRKFLVDITVSLPNGNDAKDWHYVGHRFLDLSEEFISGDNSVKFAVQAMVEDWLKKYPSAHDCLDNITEIDEGYVCDVCGSDMTPEVEDKLTLSSERRVNERANSVVHL